MNPPPIWALYPLDQLQTPAHAPPVVGRDAHSAGPRPMRISDRFVSLASHAPGGVVADPTTDTPRAFIAPWEAADPGEDRLDFASQFLGASGTLLVRSGGDDPDAPPAWLPPTRAAFEDWSRRLSASPPRSALCLWPSARGVISDIPSALSFLRRHGASQGGSWRFLLDPFSLLAPNMMAQAPDHLARLFQSLGDHADLWAVLLADARVEGERIVHQPIDAESEISSLLVRLWKDHVPGHVPVVLLATRIHSQGELLGL